MKLGHIHLKVSNLKKAEEFYTKVLGFKVRERAANYLFLHITNEHHDLALQEIPEASIPEEYSLGLYHTAWEVKTERELKQIAEKLEKAKIQFGAVNHNGISKSLYFKDPSENGVEVYIDTRKETSSQSWKGRTTSLNLSELKD